MFDILFLVSRDFKLWHIKHVCLYFHIINWEVSTLMASPCFHNLKIVV